MWLVSYILVSLLFFAAAVSILVLSCILTTPYSSSKEYDIATHFGILSKFVLQVQITHFSMDMFLILLLYCPSLYVHIYVEKPYISILVIGKRFIEQQHMAAKRPDEYYFKRYRFSVLKVEVASDQKYAVWRKYQSGSLSGSDLTNPLHYDADMTDRLSIVTKETEAQAYK